MTIRSSILAALSLLLAAHGLCNASESDINVMSAENTICDLGHISVKDGPQTCRFKITNNGSDEINLTEAITSCGCTTVKLPEGPIAPGETVNIDVTYDNKEVTKFFDKRIALRFSGIDTPMLLSVRGSSESPGRNHFKYVGRFLKYEKEEHPAGDVIQGCPVSGELKAIYRKRKPARFEFSCPDGMEVRGDEAIHRYGDTITIHYTIHTRCSDFGTVKYRILASRRIGNTVTPDKRNIAVTALSHAPCCSDNDSTCVPEMITGWKHMALGKMHAKEERTIEVPISNNGNTDLAIYRIDCNGLVEECKDIVLKPGETRTMVMKFKPQHAKKGRYAETLTIYSNDIVKPEYSLYFTYDIKATPFFRKTNTTPHH